MYARKRCQSLGYLRFGNFWWNQCLFSSSTGPFNNNPLPSHTHTWRVIATAAVLRLTTLYVSSVMNPTMCTTIVLRFDTVSFLMGCRAPGINETLGLTTHNTKTHEGGRDVGVTEGPLMTWCLESLWNLLAVLLFHQLKIMVSFPLRLPHSLPLSPSYQDLTKLRLITPHNKHILKHTELARKSSHYILLPMFCTVLASTHSPPNTLFSSLHYTTFIYPHSGSRCVTQNCNRSSNSNNTYRITPFPSLSTSVYH